ncbi:hypothetical protein [Paenibacillus bovis]|uniref:Uncharacterized protein n=1 Tax=Paenibacillus bovis TaxID=1616788 RepID=A0A1X9T448_9BACL|nr:hypothetical protein [Paenibacillus bovis]ARR10612.1 hypothetical protein AR543_p0004 [Paenibacillus bovis]
MNTLHTTKVLDWIKSRRGRSPELSDQAAAFLDGLEMRIARGDFYVSSHQLGTTELLQTGAMHQWLMRWKEDNCPEQYDFDESLDDVMIEFEGDAYFDNFEHVPDLGICDQCGKAHQDVRTYRVMTDTFIRICYYGCSDPRSSAQGTPNTVMEVMEQ